MFRRGAFLVLALLILIFAFSGLLILRPEALPPQLQDALPPVLQPHRKLSDDDLPDPGVYNWTTHSEFLFPSNLSPLSASASSLCATFPKHLLEHDIQPVLKTGHAVLDSRLTAQLSSLSACLSPHLLLFSDRSETFHSLPLIDVIAEIPASLRDQFPEQFTAYNAFTNTSIHPDSDSGWKIDKFKFLAGISTAWRLRPDKRWYVFYEGDTFVVWDNVFRFLQGFDADAEWYFGSPSPGRTDGDTTTWFAYGGSGFILSRGAMKKLVAKDWSPKGEYLGTKLTENHWGDVLQDCCGDSIVGWALWVRGIKLSGIWPMFNPHPPHGVPFSDRYWCQPVLSMHKPETEHMEELWRWQFAAREASRPLLYRDLALSYFNITKQSLTYDWDNSDFDSYDPPLDQFPAAHSSIEECNAACTKSDACFQWTYRPFFNDETGEFDRMACKFVRSFRMGKRVDVRSGKQFVAGWVSKRILEWTEAEGRACEEVRWVKPSIKRIF